MHIHTRASRIAPALPLAALSLLASAPALAATDALCAHPLQAGPCAKLYAIVSVPYMVMAVAPTWGALAILKPRIAPRAWVAAMLLTPLWSWIAAMIGFTIGGLSGLISYPHDASPFFFVSWFQMLWVLLAHGGFVVSVFKAAPQR